MLLVQLVFSQLVEYQSKRHSKIPFDRHYYPLLLPSSGNSCKATYQTWALVRLITGLLIIIVDGFILFLKGVEFGGDEALKGFTSSLERDTAATQQLFSSSSSSFDRKSWNEFISILEDCQGQIFTSGIGT